MEAQMPKFPVTFRNPCKKSFEDFYSNKVQITIRKAKDSDEARKAFPFQLWDSKEDELQARIEHHELHRHTALAYAAHVLELPRDDGDFLRLVYSIDGSAEAESDSDNVHGAFAICPDEKTKDGQFVGQVQEYFVEKSQSIQWLEMMAITEAVHQTVLRLRSSHRRRGELYVFSDCATVLSFLARVPDETPYHKLTLTPVYDYLVLLSEELHRRGFELVIPWIPGHKHQVACHVRSDIRSRKLRRQCVKRLNQIREKPDTIPWPSAGIAYFDPPGHNSIWPILHARSVAAAIDFETTYPKLSLFEPSMIYEMLYEWYIAAVEGGMETAEDLRCRREDLLRIM